jgi:S1-C subfamily serine protease
LAQEAVHEILGDDYPLEPWNPVGQPALFRDLGDEPDSFWTADAPEPLHLFARLALGDIADGDHVEIVGHPHGFVWSYVEGCVSSVLSSVPGAPTSGKVLQIEGAVSHGNSGGGAFNDAGRLVGVASFMVENLNGTGFFVHRDTVRDFLHRAGAA